MPNPSGIDTVATGDSASTTTAARAGAIEVDVELVMVLSPVEVFFSEAQSSPAKGRTGNLDAGGSQ